MADQPAGPGHVHAGRRAGRAPAALLPGLRAQGKQRARRQRPLLPALARALARVCCSRWAPAHSSARSAGPSARARPARARAGDCSACGSPPRSRSSSSTPRRSSSRASSPRAIRRASRGIFGDGGWLSLPAAAAVGVVLALLVRGGRAAIEFAARLRRERPPLRRDSARILRPTPVFLIAAAPLAACSPSRAPPSWL